MPTLIHPERVQCDGIDAAHDEFPFPIPLGYYYDGRDCLIGQGRAQRQVEPTADVLAAFSRLIDPATRAALLAQRQTAQQADIDARAAAEVSRRAALTDEQRRDEDTDRLRLGSRVLAALCSIDAARRGGTFTPAIRQWAAGVIDATAAKVVEARG